MEWTVPRYDRAAVDAAGKTLRDDSSDLDVWFDALEVLDNWRSSHAFPLNTFQTVLRNRARKLDPQATVAQRLKRVPSIMAKLQRQRSMRLTQMQDIGGCRAVLRDVAAARRLRDNYLRRPSNAVFVSTKDYIQAPRDSGYRSIHLIYRYNSGRSAKRAAFNGLQIEIQIRSRLQHAWATAVETVGLLTNQALKSEQGEADWLELFRYISTMFAYAERTPGLPGMPDVTAIVREVQARADALRMTQRLRAVRQALRLIERSASRESRYFLMKLDAAAESLAVRGFAEDEIDLATAEYAAAEQAAVGSTTDVVLVRADSVKALRKAYPNYFLDTAHFLMSYEQLVAGKRTRLGAKLAI